MKSAIDWTDAHWEPVLGCSPAGAGCANCWAERMTWRLAHNPVCGARYAGLTELRGGRPRWTGVVRTNEDALAEPLRLRKPSKIFVCSRADLFHESVPFDFVDRVFGVMAACRCIGRGDDAFPGHTFQVLTKRTGRAREYLRSDRRAEWAYWAAHFGGGRDPDGIYDQTAGGPRELPNVWLIASASTQPEVDASMRELVATPAAVRGLSLEPLVERVDLDRWLGLLPGHEWAECLCGEIHPKDRPCLTCVSRRALGAASGLHWVVVGGESGPHARPMHPDWARSLRDLCASAGVSFYFKQWGEWSAFYDRDLDDPDWRRCPDPSTHERYLNLVGGHGFHGERVVAVRRVGKKAAGHLLDGREHREMPEVRT